MTEVQVAAWRVHDTGLVAVPARFRRLGGLVRHLQGHGRRRGRARVTLALVDGELRAAGADGAVGRLAASATCPSARVAAGPPVSFVLEVPGSTHLLAAAADAATESLLAALS